MKVFIADIVERLKGNPEPDLGKDTVICFENEAYRFDIKFGEDDSIQIYKIAKGHDDKIHITAVTGNVVMVK